MKNETINLPASANQAVLLIHGFTGSPSELEDLGHYLHEKGFHVEIPLLPGHGTKPGDLKKVGKRQWLQTLHEAIEHLSQDGKKICLVGLSMGASLAIHLAHENPKIKVLVCISTPYWFRNRWRHWGMTALDFCHLWNLFPKKGFKKPRREISITRKRFSYDVYPRKALRSFLQLVNQSKKMAKKIQQPVFFIHSKADLLIPFEGMEKFIKRFPKKPKTLLLEGFDHVIPCDPKRAEIFPKIMNFLKEYSIPKIH